jgi:hypothetical protein
MSTCPTTARPALEEEEEEDDDDGAAAPAPGATGSCCDSRVKSGGE